MTLLLKYLDILAAIMVGDLDTYNDVAEVCETKAETLDLGPSLGPSSRRD